MYRINILNCSKCSQLDREKFYTETVISNCWKEDVTVLQHTKCPIVIWNVKNPVFVPRTSEFNLKSFKSKVPQDFKIKFALYNKNVHSTFEFYFLCSVSITIIDKKLHFSDRVAKVGYKFL